MLSYQHSYHAGNLADVHKHALLAFALDYMTLKNKPLSYIETHAGRGLYDLAAPEALKTGEAAQGIERTATWFAATHPYARARDAVRAHHGVSAYPGSPLIAAMLLRACDKIQLAEKHPNELRHLKQALPKAKIVQSDGLHMALSLCPPRPRRGVMLVDPSYERKDDYSHLPKWLAQIHKRWNVGVVLLWYPILIRGPHTSMLDALTKTLPNGLRHEVRFPPMRPGHGMVGSGLFVLNAPYGFADEAAWLSTRFHALPT